MHVRGREDSIDRLRGEFGRVLIQVAGCDAILACLEKRGMTPEADLHRIRAATRELATLDACCLLANFRWWPLPWPRAIGIRQAVFVRHVSILGGQGSV